MMRISESGIALIRRFEGCKLKAYRDVAGIWTIGFGHTGDDVYEGQTITQDEADEWLRLDIAEFEDCVNDVIDIEITQNQFDALVSFAFNCGCAALTRSALLRLLNNGMVDAAAEQFARWNKAGGREVAGLTNRRRAERDLFLA